MERIHYHIRNETEIHYSITGVLIMKNPFTTLIGEIVTIVKLFGGQCLICPCCKAICPINKEPYYYCTESGIIAMYVPITSHTMHCNDRWVWFLMNPDYNNNLIASNHTEFRRKVKEYYPIFILSEF